jgi:hypothetical protein
VQLIVLPLNVVMALFIGHYKDVYQLRTYRQRIKDASTDDATSLGKTPHIAQTISENEGSGGPTGNCFDDVGRMLNTVGKFNLDVPLNRFIAFSWSYVFFLIVISDYLLTHQTLDPEHPRRHFEEHTLACYIVSFVLKDVIKFATYRAKSFSNFWRVYDFIWHFLLLGLWIAPDENAGVPLVIGRRIK